MHKALVPLAAAAAFLVAILIIIFIFAGGSRQSHTIQTLPQSYAECVAQGYPVMEIYPSQCRAGGRTFTNPNEVAPTPPAVVTFETVKANQLVSSPLTVKGTVIGGWCFEASCPVRVLDANGKVLGTGVASVPEWQTDALVSFEATITFTKSTTDTGTLELSNDNPSGLPENEKKAGIPIRFK